MKIGIVGYGWVGKAMKKLFPDAAVYDPVIPMSKPLVNYDINVIAVPTPWNGQTLDTSIVEQAMKENPASLYLLRSTVMPGFCDQMEQKHGWQIVYQPEYLGETPAHPFLEMETRKFIVLGGKKSNIREIINIYVSVYNANVKIDQMTAKEAEVVKLSENRAIFWKVMQCQELYDACAAAGVDYYTIRDTVYGTDPRFNLWWTFVYPWARGANSKCIPKDVYGWAAWAESVGFEPHATNSLLKYNENLLEKHS